MARKNKMDAGANGAPFIDIGIPAKDREKIALGLSECSQIRTAST